MLFLVSLAELVLVAETVLEVAEVAEIAVDSDKVLSTLARNSLRVPQPAQCLYIHILCCFDSKDLKRDNIYFCIHMLINISVGDR